MIYYIRDAYNPRESFSLELKEETPVPRFNLRLVTHFDGYLRYSDIPRITKQHIAGLEQILYSYRARLQQFERAGVIDAQTVATLCEPELEDINVLKHYVSLMEKGAKYDFA